MRRMLNRTFIVLGVTFVILTWPLFMLHDCLTQYGARTIQRWQFWAVFLCSLAGLAMGVGVWQIAAGNLFQEHAVIGTVLFIGSYFGGLFTAIQVIEAYSGMIPEL